MLKGLEKMEAEANARHELIGSMIDMLAQTGDTKFLLLKEHHKLHNAMDKAMNKIADEKEIKEDKINRFISIFKQFQQIIEDELANTTRD